MTTSEIEALGFEKLSREDFISLRRVALAVAPLLKKISVCYSDDPGTSDLDDEQPAYNPKLTLGDVRLARRLLR